MYIIIVELKGVGEQYVSASGVDGAWFTRYEHRAKGFKTERAARRWLMMHPEVDGRIAWID